MDAGVTDCWACLEGRRVVCLGALGDFYVEWFSWVWAETGVVKRLH